MIRITILESWYISITTILQDLLNYWIRQENIEMHQWINISPNFSSAGKEKNKAGTTWWAGGFIKKTTKTNVLFWEKWMKCRSPESHWLRRRRRRWKHLVHCEEVRGGAECGGVQPQQRLMTAVQKEQLFLLLPFLLLHPADFTSYI